MSRVDFLFFLMIRRPPRSTRTDTLFPYTTLFRSAQNRLAANLRHGWRQVNRGLAVIIHLRLVGELDVVYSSADIRTAVARVGLAMLDIAVERDACPHVPSHPVLGDPSRRIKLARRAHPMRDTARARRPIYAHAGGIIRIFRTRTKAETEAWSGHACRR